MGKFAQGFYTLKNPQKYIGLGQPKYRSSWELVFCQFCDNNEKVLQWASEPMRLPYRNPLTGKQTVYVPDFLVMYQGRDGRPISEMIEIKPSAQTNITEARSARDRASVAVNQAKWQAANAYCKKLGIQFRVITEKEIFHQGRGK
jgi:hypothetical protein